MSFDMSNDERDERRAEQAASAAKSRNPMIHGAAPLCRFGGIACSKTRHFELVCGSDITRCGKMS
jgi:hypothetical protein